MQLFPNRTVQLRYLYRYSTLQLLSTLVIVLQGCNKTFLIFCTVEMKKVPYNTDKNTLARSTEGDKKFYSTQYHCKISFLHAAIQVTNFCVKLGGRNYSRRDMMRLLLPTSTKPHQRKKDRERLLSISLVGSNTRTLSQLNF